MFTLPTLCRVVCQDAGPDPAAHHQPHQDHANPHSDHCQAQPATHQTGNECHAAYEDACVSFSFSRDSYDSQLPALDTMTHCDAVS